MNFFFSCRCENLSVEKSDGEKSHEEDEDDYFEKLEIKKKEKSNVKSKEKGPRQSFQEQMIELQKMQLKAFEESEKQQQHFFEQMIEVQRKDDAVEKGKRQTVFYGISYWNFFMEVLSK